MNNKKGLNSSRGRQQGICTDRSHYKKNNYQNIIKINNFTNSIIEKTTYITNNNMSNSGTVQFTRKPSYNNLKNSSKKIESYLNTLANASSGGTK